MTTFASDDGMMRMPSPDDPSSGYAQTRPGYAIGSAPAEAPAGTVYVPAMGTYVDADIAASLGFGAPAAQRDPGGDPGAETLRAAPEVPEANTPAEGWSDTDLDDIGEMSDEELAALQEELEVRSENGDEGQPLYRAIADMVPSEAITATLSDMVDTGDGDAVIETLAQHSGLDHRTAEAAIVGAIQEAAPIAVDHLGEGAWQSILYAATSTPDPLARQIVTELVTGKLHPSKLTDAYALWWQSLPDAD